MQNATSVKSVLCSRIYAINKSDDEGKDAWWIQSPNSVPFILGNAGHTSLLLQEKSGYWWYFYWGDKSVQLLFIETSSLREITGKVRDQINYYNRNYSNKFGKLYYYENYTQAIQFSGHFENSIKEIKKLSVIISIHIALALKERFMLGLDIHQKNIKVKTDHILIY